MDKQSIIDVVNKSPKAVAANDKEAWVNIFQPLAFVKDPVSAPAHIGHAQIGTFYDTFIKSNGISFAISRDFVDEKARRLIRVADIHIAFKRTQNGITQPAHIIYDLEAESMKVSSLQAVWEVFQARPYAGSVRQLLQSLLLMTASFWPIVRNYGIWWTVKYTLGLMIGPISGGKGLVHGLLDSCTKAQETPFCELFQSGENPCVKVGRATIKPSAFYNTLWSGTEYFSIMGSIKSSGWKTTFAYHRTTRSGLQKSGFVELDVMWKSPLRSVITSMYVFEEEDGVENEGSTT